MKKWKEVIVCDCCEEERKISLLVCPICGKNICGDCSYSIGREYVAMDTLMRDELYICRSHLPKGIFDKK